MTWESLQPGTRFHSFGGQEAGTSSVVSGHLQKGISSCCHSGLIPGSLAVGSWGTRREGIVTLTPALQCFALHLVAGILQPRW